MALTRRVDKARLSAPPSTEPLKVHDATLMHPTLTFTSHAVYVRLKTPNQVIKLRLTMHVISVINYKGGVGKTTITANLATELARRGRQVLLIDVDPQTNLTLSFVTPEEWQKKYSETKTIRRWFKSFEEGRLPLDLSELVFSPIRVNEKLKELGATGRVDMIASHLELINIDLELAMELSGSSLRQSAKNFLKVHGRLAQGLRQIKGKDYELILIDCPPNFNIVTKTAIIASDHLLIPTKADYLSTLGINYLVNSLNRLVSDYNDYVNYDMETSVRRICPLILGVIFNMVQVYGNEPIATQRDYINRVKKLKIPVFETYLRESKTAYAATPESGIPTVLSSTGKATEEIRYFISEFEQKLGLNV